MPRFETGSSSCLVRLHSHSECRRCQEVCPAGAISRTEDRTMRVDQSACIGCGLCLSACPTAVFAITGLDMGALVDTIAGRAEGGAVTVRCASAAPPEQSSADVVDLPCIGMLDDDLILALAGSGVRTLLVRVGDCEACVLGARDRIDTVLAKASSRWPDRLSVVMEREPGNIDPDFLAALNGLTGLSQPVTVDRRGFLRNIVNRARDLANEPARSSAHAWGSRPLPTRVSVRRSALLASIRDDDPVAFPRIAIGESCDGCRDAHSLCDRFCPTGALRRIDSEGGAQFVFQPETCVDCGHCAFVCPQDAVIRETDTTSRSPIALKTLPAGTCSVCKATAIHFVDGLCPECGRRAEVRDMLVDWIREPR